jgi:hypothetical protein
MSVKEIGCFGAYCKTCRASAASGFCRGCKLGYENGKRDINKSKCKIKTCCFRDRNFETCAGCNYYSHCKTIQSLYANASYKHGKYRQSMDFIRKNGYRKFMNIADAWTGPYGKLS